MPKAPGTRLARLAILLLFACLVAPASEGPGGLPGTGELFAPVPDPLEPYNRGVETLNRHLARKLVRPLGAVYDAVVPGFLRTGIDNFGRNCLFPLRLVNCALQGKGGACLTETRRFALNTTVGLLGFLDPATARGIPLEDEDFGQTLAVYGVGDGCYVNWPLLGPSSARDTLGLLLGLPFSPLFWIASDPVRIGAGSAVAANRAAGDAPALDEYFAVNPQTYPLTKALYFQRRRILIADERLAAPATPPDPDQALDFLFFRPRDPGTVARRRTARARLDDRHAMPYACWPRRNRTSLERKQDMGIVVVLPGIGGSHLSSGTAALAEVFRRHGWNCIALSSTFSPDYLAALPERVPPGYFPRDAEILDGVLRRVVADFRERHPRADPLRRPVSIVGYSLGGIDALFLAARAARDPGRSLPVRRYLAINPPVRVLEALRTIDGYCDIPLGWPEADRERRAQDLYHRLGLILAGSPRPGAAPPSGNGHGPFPFSREESRFLIGLNMRLQLTQMLFACGRDLGLPPPAGPVRADDRLWRATLGISYHDYMRDYVLAFYRRRDPGRTPEAMLEDCSLTSLEGSLAGDGRVRVFQNRNDFLVPESALPWYRRVLGDRAVIFPDGSHLGNLGRKPYQDRILEAVEE